MRFYAPPFRFEERGETYWVVDANGQSVAMMMWPGHPPEETDAAVDETEAVARAFAGAINIGGSHE